LYGIHLWGNSSNVERVLKLQKKAIRVMNRCHFKEHCKPLFVQCRILTVISAYIYVCLCKVKVKLDFQGFHIRSDNHSYNTRNKWQLDQTFSRLTVSQRWYDHISIKMFNRLPKCVYELDVNNFKTVLYRFLIARPFYHVKEYFEIPLVELHSAFSQKPIVTST